MFTTVSLLLMRQVSYHLPVSFWVHSARLHCHLLPETWPAFWETSPNCCPKIHTQIQYIQPIPEDVYQISQTAKFRYYFHSDKSTQAIVLKYMLRYTTAKSRYWIHCQKQVLELLSWNRITNKLQLKHEPD